MSLRGLAVLRPSDTAGRSRPFAQFRPTTRVWLLAGVLVATALSLHLVAVRSLPPVAAPAAVPWWVLAIAFYLVEIKVVHLQFQREAHSYTLSEVVLVVGLFLAPPAELVLANVLGAGLGLLVHRRPTTLKFAFNVSSFLLQAVVAIAVFRLFPAAGPFAPLSWLAAFLATLAATTVGLAAVTAAVHVTQGRSDRSRVAESIRFALVVAFTNTGLALVGVTLLWIGPDTLWLLAIPALLGAVALRSYRAWVAERDQRESLELLYETTRVLHGSTELGSTVVSLLQAARARFRAEVAEIVLLTDPERGEALRSSIGPDGTVVLMAPVRLAPDADSLQLRAIAERRSFAVAPSRTASEGSRVGDRRIRDAIVAPLSGERRVIGTLLVANRMGNVGSFRPDEVRLCQTLANHAGVAVENGQLGQSLQQASELSDQLSWAATHDALTGLANRTLFADHVAQTLGSASAAAVPAVLFLDLDDFKGVNDRLGHAAGDELLRAVAGRLRSCLRTHDIAARLGGDEFAVLLEDARTVPDAVRLAERIVRTLSSPFRIEGQEVRTAASVGVAPRRTQHDGPDELMRDADVAMYTAKSLGKGRVALFEEEMHAATAERRARGEQLKAAVATGAFVLHYQPIMALRSGLMTGVEALVRMRDEGGALVEPADFLPLAEQNGLIVDVGRWVLGEACRQLAEWSAIDASAASLSVSVNISARQLADPRLVGDVVHALEASGLDPTRLLLEITETVLVADPDSALERLRALHDRGVRIAVDNFGAGFASLGYLRAFPVDVLKLGRGSLDGDGERDGGRFAAAIVALGHSLELEVTAEGIERRDQLERLRALECDSAQGYHVARPMDAASVRRLLGRRGEVALAA